MPNAIDMFREQREAADQVHTRLIEVSALLAQLRRQVDAVATNEELRAVLRQEQSWLAEVQRAVAEVRAFREQEMRRFWPGVWRRWALAVAFALASAAAAGAGYGRVAKANALNVAALGSRIEFADLVERRLQTMTAAERRQFDALMKWTPQPKHRGK